MHDENCFITLTYDDENYPQDQSLVKSHFQQFIRKLRKQNPDKTIRYMMCGEYGENNSRAHYHALLFGYDFPDRYRHHFADPLDSIGNHAHRPIDGRDYHSEELTELWGKGICHVGELNFKTAAYTARYTMKKVTGELADKIDPETGLKPYERHHLQTGQVVEVLPEYLQASNRPGIGASFYERYKTDMFPGDTVYLGHSKDMAGKSRPVFVKPPKYYEKLLDREHPDVLEFIKECRVDFAQSHPELFTDEKLDTKEIILSHRAGQLVRHL